MKKLILLVALAMMNSGCVVHDLRNLRARNIQDHQDAEQCTAAHPNEGKSQFRTVEWAKCMNKLRAEHIAAGLDGYDTDPSKLGAIPDGMGHWGYGFSGYSSSGWTSGSWSRSGAHK